MWLEKCFKLRFVEKIYFIKGYIKLSKCLKFLERGIMEIFERVVSEVVMNVEFFIIGVFFSVFYKFFVK